MIESTHSLSLSLTYRDMAIRHSSLERTATLCGGVHAGAVGQQDAHHFIMATGTSAHDIVECGLDGRACKEKLDSLHNPFTARAAKRYVRDHCAPNKVIVGARDNHRRHVCKLGQSVRLAVKDKQINFSA
jgi:hypothetical protein